MSSNARLQKALEAAAEESKAAEPVSPVVSEEIKQKVDAKLKDPLKGVSKSLLERIRAKQVKAEAVFDFGERLKEIRINFEFF